MKKQVEGKNCGKEIRRWRKYSRVGGISLVIILAGMLIPYFITKNGVVVFKISPTFTADLLVVPAYDMENNTMVNLTIGGSGGIIEDSSKFQLLFNALPGGNLIYPDRQVWRVPSIDMRFDEDLSNLGREVLYNATVLGEENEASAYLSTPAHTLSLSGGEMKKITLLEGDYFDAEPINGFGVKYSVPRGNALSYIKLGIRSTYYPPGGTFFPDNEPYWFDVDAWWYGSGICGCVVDYLTTYVTIERVTFNVSLYSDWYNWVCGVSVAKPQASPYSLEVSITSIFDIADFFGVVVGN